MGKLVKLLNLIVGMRSTLTAFPTATSHPNLKTQMSKKYVQFAKRKCNRLEIEKKLNQTKIIKH